MTPIELKGKDGHFFPDHDDFLIKPELNSKDKDLTNLFKEIKRTHEEGQSGESQLPVYSSEAVKTNDDPSKMGPKSNLQSKITIPPQIYVGFDEDQQPKISIGREAPVLKNLVLSGGGAKGIVYPAFLKEFNKDVGLINSIQQVAGTSAGALMAFLISAGVTIDEIDEFSNKLNILDELKEKIESPINKEIVLGNGILPALKLRETIVNLTAKPTYDYYKSHIKNSPVIINKIQNDPKGADFLKRAEAGFSLGITFYDLKILHELEPKMFKLLNVTSYDKDRKKKVFFNAEKTPDINCFEAVVASMSLPFIMKSVFLDLKDGKGKRNLMDGGVATNIPLEFFSKKEGYNPAETLVLHFDNGGAAHAKLHSGHKSLMYRIFLIILRVFGKLFLGIQNFDTIDKDAKKLKLHGFNAFVVPHGDIRTIDFNILIDSPRCQRAIQQAKKAAAMYATLSSPGHLVQEEYNNICKAINSLSFEELKALFSIANDKIRMAEVKIEGGKEKLINVEKLHIEIMFYMNIILEYQKRSKK